MSEITIERNASPAKLDVLAVDRWAIWEKEVSVFDWTYEQTEMCYVLEGEVIVTPENGEPVTIGEGDLVTFEQGLKCTWDIKSPIRKHYMFK